MPRAARANPGRRHLAGADVTAKMQRQYEHILGSLGQRRRHFSPGKRKQIAAATVRKLAQNPRSIASLLRYFGVGVDDESQAQLLSEGFHGRPAREFIDIEETETYDKYVGVLGYLEELNILSEDEEHATPIRFSYEDDKDTVWVVSNPAGTNIEFIGGDQDIDWQRVDGAGPEDKYLVCVGPVFSIAYFTDKHHLEGPKSQRYGTPYEHEFAEHEGELPFLVFDRRNIKLLLVGGTYTITPEGIDG